MIDQTSSILDHPKNKESKLKKIKPTHFLIIFVGISMLLAFIIGGYLIEKNNNKKERQNAAVTLEEQVNLNPIDLPGNPANWTVYKFEPLNIEFKLPEELNKKADWKVNEINGDTGKVFCFSDEEIQNEEECISKTLVIAATSNNFKSNKNATFLDSQGFETENGIYSVKSLSGNMIELTNVLLKPYDNNKNFEILKIVGNNTSGSETPGEGYLGAILNTNNPEFPAVVLKMNINGDISEYEFDQILESLQTTK